VRTLAPRSPTDGRKPAKPLAAQVVDLLAGERAHRDLLSDPRAVGAEQAEHRTRWHLQVDPSSEAALPNRLRSPSTTIALSVMPHTLAQMVEADQVFDYFKG
jgi:hypothetical protein